MVDDVVIIAEGRVRLAAPLADLAGDGSPRLRVRGGDPRRLWAAFEHAGGAVAADGQALYVEGLTAEVFLGVLFSWVSEEFRSLFAGLGAFGVAVVGTSQHYQHRTAVLLFLGQPRRLRALTAQCLVAVLIATVLAAVSGVLLFSADEGGQYRATLTAVPLVAIFGVANATVIRRPLWLLGGYAGWLLFVEGLIGKLESPLPFSSFLTAATGDTRHLLIFLGWTVAVLLAAVWSITRDLTGD